MDDRYVLDLAELAVIRFECGACATAVSIPTKLWTARSNSVRTAVSRGRGFGSHVRADQLVVHRTRGIIALSAEDVSYRINSRFPGQTPSERRWAPNHHP